MSYLEDEGDPRETVPFLVEPILIDMEGGRYMGPLLTATLAEIISTRRDGGGGSGRRNGRGGGSGGVSGGGSRTIHGLQ